jgi:hypothetical protein
MFLPPQSILPLAQLCMEYEYLVNARLGFAMAVAVAINSVYHDASMIPLCSDKRNSI